MSPTATQKFNDSEGKEAPNMTSIFEITDWAHVASFFVWTLAVCALAKAIFGSFPAAELQYRLTLRDNPRRQRLNRLNWEVANRTKWDEDVARGSQHAAAVPLTEVELDARRAELRRLSSTSLPWRALQYLLNCWACQTFWVAVAVFALTRGALDVPSLLFSAASYSSAATVFGLVHSARDEIRPMSGSAKLGCKTCGTGP